MSGLSFSIMEDSNIPIMHVKIVATEMEVSQTHTVHLPEHNTHIIVNIREDRGPFLDTARNAGEPLPSVPTLSVPARADSERRERKDPGASAVCKTF